MEIGKKEIHLVILVQNVIDSKERQTMHVLFIVEKLKTLENLEIWFMELKMLNVSKS